MTTASDVNNLNGHDNTVKLVLPPAPEKPLPSDCCGSGCNPCVLDIYEEELQLWEQECLHLSSGSQPPPKKTNHGKMDFVLSVHDYTKFEIIDVSQETLDSFRFTFGIHKEKSLGLKVGQHVILRERTETDIVVRQYTPISPVWNKGSFVLLIKIYPDGKMSNFVKEWKINTTVDMRGPAGSFVYRPNKYKRVLMLAAGTGIAPMAQVIQSILSNEDDEILINLLFCCRFYADILMKPEIKEWSRFWNFSVKYFLSQEKDCSQFGYGEDISLQRLDSESLKEMTKTYDVTDTLILICGTKSFEKDMLSYCRLFNFQEKFIHKF